MPERIQLSRRKGWRKPENTVVVARPSKWGNPYQVIQRGKNWQVVDKHGRNGIFLAYRRSARAYAVQMLKDLFEQSRWFSASEIAAELAGKNLACWCPLDEPCHADLLLEIANQEETE